jgi:hypothetical protein
MAWFPLKMAWLLLHLVQLVIFWTSYTLTYAKCQHFNKGYCCLYQGQQLSYIVLDIYMLDLKIILAHPTLKQNTH